MKAADREKRLLEIGSKVVKTSRADETEVLLSEGREFLTRFSRNRIHQNVGTEEVWAVVRLVKGKRVGVASASSLAAEALETAVASALAIKPNRAISEAQSCRGACPECFDVQSRRFAFALALVLVGHE